MSEPEHAAPSLPVWRRFAAAVRYLRDAEPAVITAVWRAALGVAIAAGVTLPGWLDERGAAIIAAVYVLLAVSQGVATRRKVFAPATVRARAAELAASGQVRVEVGPAVADAVAREAVRPTG